MPPPRGYALSSTMRIIYVIRYLLFSGGLAVLGAIAERMVSRSDGQLGGLLTGLVLGLVVFRGQLRPLAWPKLVLGQEALYLVQRRRAVALPWKKISEIAAVDGRVTIRFREPMTAPDGRTTEAVELEARKFGAGTGELAEALRGLLASDAERAQLPPDDRIRQRWGS